MNSVTTAEREPPVPYIQRTREKYDALGYDEFRWLASEPPAPWSPLRKPLAESHLGLISTGGVYRNGQTAFSYKDDTTYRAIPTDVETSQLRATHFTYDLTDARTDINCVFPIDTLHRLVGEGAIKGLTQSFYTCMGGIYSQRRVREELVPALVERCVDDEIDVVLLVPV